MLRAYRLVSPDSPHAPPHLWECEQPYIDHLIENARTFGRPVVQRYFRDRDAYAQENARIWRRFYLPKPLYQPVATWEAWLTEYRTILIDVQALLKWLYSSGHTETRAIVPHWEGCTWPKNQGPEARVNFPCRF